MRAVSYTHLDVYKRQAVYNMEGKEVDKIELNDSIFGVEINEHLVHMAVPVSYTHLPDGSLAFGSPAKVVRALTADEIEENHRNAMHYVEIARESLI